MHHPVNVFFYGSYMNFDVLSEAGIGERPYDIAHLSGYRLRISPFANLVSDNSSDSYGILTQLTHKELNRLYIDHAQGKLGAIYLPKAVMVQTDDREPTPALCYVSYCIQAEEPCPDYIEGILVAARKYGFPPEYINYIASMNAAPVTA